MEFPLYHHAPGIRPGTGNYTRVWRAIPQFSRELLLHRKAQVVDVGDEDRSTIGPVEGLGGIDLKVGIFRSTHTMKVSGGETTPAANLSGQPYR